MSFFHSVTDESTTDAFSLAVSEDMSVLASNQNADTVKDSSQILL